MDNFNNFNSDDINNMQENDMNTVNASYTIVDEKKAERKPEKKGLHKRIASYIIVGIVCSMLGGTAAGGAILYLLPRSQAFNDTPLYQSIKQNNNSGGYISATPASASTGTGALTATEIAKKVGPAVVGVSIKSPGQVDIFGFQQDDTEGIGSGIIFNEEGYILTNYHVIDGANEINVILSSKQEVPAKVVNYDENLDLAVIKVTKSVKMPAIAEFGNSKDVQVGDPVVAIGNPLGKELLGTVTAGVISAVNREIKVGKTTQTLLQTDAAINPGNSGGALVNSLGQVIGINSAKMGGSGVEGLGFAIPIDIVKPKINNLLKPILKIGISCRDITSEISKRYDLPVGIYVAEVQQFSPAEKAGLRAGDVITKFDGKKVKTTEELNSIKSTHKSGDEVKLEVTRDDKNITVTMKLTE